MVVIASSNTRAVVTTGAVMHLGTLPAEVSLDITVYPTKRVVLRDASGGGVSEYHSPTVP